MAIQNRGFEVSPLSAKQIKNAAKALDLLNLIRPSCAYFSVLQPFQEYANQTFRKQN